MHPLTSEKLELRNLAAQIKDTKNYLRISKPMTNGEMARQQQILADYKRVYRHRHIAYCLVRRDNGDGIEAKNSRPYNETIVLKHQVRLLQAIKMYYSDMVTDFVKGPATWADIAREKKTLMQVFEDAGFFEEAAELTPECWEGIQLPYCEFIPVSGLPQQLFRSDFDETPTGDLVFNVTCPGIIALYDGNHHDVDVGCTVNLDGDAAIPKITGIIRKDLTYT